MKSIYLSNTSQKPGVWIKKSFIFYPLHKFGKNAENFAEKNSNYDVQQMQKKQLQVVLNFH